MQVRCAAAVKAKDEDGALSDLVLPDFSIVEDHLQPAQGFKYDGLEQPSRYFPRFLDCNAPVLKSDLQKGTDRQGEKPVHEVGFE